MNKFIRIYHQGKSEDIVNIEQIDHIFFGKNLNSLHIWTTLDDPIIVESTDVMEWDYGVSEKLDSFLCDFKRRQTLKPV